MRLDPYRAVLCVFLLSLTALSAHAQEEPAPEPARFLIEKITVEGPKAAPANIVRAETLLKEGESYTEEQLRQAVYRVHHLPFVLDASFALRKGSERGAYELFIEVQPARWFFYDHWIRAYQFDEPLSLEEGDITPDFDRTSASLGGLVGARLFVGRSGVLFAALDSHDGAQGGFTQYDLFGRGILASAGYSRNLCCVREVLPLGLDPTFSYWSYDESQKISLSFVVPLGGRQSVQATFSERRGEASDREEILFRAPGFFSFIQNGDLTYRRAEGKWVYDTSDDPLVPTRGVSVSAGLEASRFEGRGLRFALFGIGSFEPVSFPTYEAEQVVAAVSGIRHWSVTPRQTVSATGRIAAGQSRVENLPLEAAALPATDFDYYGGSVGVQHAATLKRSRGTGNFTDLRLESGAELGAEKVSPEVKTGRLERLQVWTSLVFRNPWGRIRLVLSYLDIGGVFR
ncbi:MAG TPA: hypothetical protein VG477_05825 [Thermoanaerobaculia bacterium]|nr:hypothetical protein [Thermoanaerobaculia bacterium]